MKGGWNKSIKNGAFAFESILQQPSGSNSKKLTSLHTNIRAFL
jgi:hypothetical protein